MQLGASWIAQGGYEPVAKILSNQIAVDEYFMEFDPERAGGFAPRRFVPKNRTLLLGLATSKAGALESAAELERRIGGATKYIDLQQLCLNPQCGFASTEEGNAFGGRTVGQAGAHRGGCPQSMGRAQ
jgi:methionine synthase II (cobalamin-independent)